MFKITSLIAALLLSAPAFSAPDKQSAPTGTPQGLAIGQNPKLLQMTRESNAGAGNGGEFYRICDPTRAHRMCSTVDVDPGNSQLHNQSPECDIINCAFGPNQGF